MTAHSPQAKGRVERANQTLQDRLVKEMRLRGIGDMAAGNAYLPEFMADFNRRFAVAPRSAEDAHREVLHDAGELDLILCEQHARKLTKNLAISFEGRLYQVTGRGKGYRLRGAAVTVCKGFDGAVTVLRDGRELPVRLLAEGEPPAPVEDEKTVACGSSARRRSSGRGGRGSRRRIIRGGDRSSPRRRWPPDDGAGAVLFGRSAPSAHGHSAIPTAAQTCNLDPKAKGDISTLEKRGHFYFALTERYEPRRVRCVGFAEEILTSSPAAIQAFLREGGHHVRGASPRVLRKADGSSQAQGGCGGQTPSQEAAA